MRAGSWCSRGQTLYDTHTFTPLMKLAPSWTLYYWISSYVVWESQRRTIQTSCSYWLQFDSLFTRLLLRFSSSLPQGQNWLYCSADCCLQMVMEQVRSSCSWGAPSQMSPLREYFVLILMRHIIFHQSATLLDSKGVTDRWTSLVSAGRSLWWIYLTLTSMNGF